MPSVRRPGARLALATLAALVCIVCTSVACVDKEAAAKKKADQQKAFMEAESNARAAQEAADAKKALDDATASCTAGKPEGCIALGRIHTSSAETSAAQKKPDVDAHRKAAAAAFSSACALKSKEGCRMAADTETDGKAKLGHMKSLCALDEADACLQGAALADTLVQAGQLADAKKPTDRDAIQLLDRACTLGTAVACTARGVALLADEPREAQRSLTKGCDANEPTACLQLANVIGAKGAKKKDLARAKTLRQKACDAGLKDAC